LSWTEYLMSKDSAEAKLRSATSANKTVVSVENAFIVFA
jgi:hypothetical protein